MRTKKFDLGGRVKKSLRTPSLQQVNQRSENQTRLHDILVHNKILGGHVARKFRWGGPNGE